MAAAAVLRQEFWNALQEPEANSLIIDLSQVPELSPGAVALFIATKNVVTRRKGRFLLVGVTAENTSLLTRTNLAGYFETSDSLESALAVT